MMISTEQQSEQEFVEQQIEVFGRCYGQPTLQLLMHGAFAMALTPKLLYCLRENSDQFANLAEVPWSAPADVLLSSLCRRVGHNLYEMLPVLRMALLRRLKLSQGDHRIEQLGDFMACYIADNLEESEGRSELVGGEPEWTVLACLTPGRLVNQIKIDLQRRWQQQSDDHFYWSAVIASFGEMLPDYQPLLTELAGEIEQGKMPQPDQTDWATQYGVKLTWQEVVVGKVRVVDEVMTIRNPDLLQTFDFMVAMVNQLGKEISRVPQKGQYFIELLGDSRDATVPWLELVAIPGGVFVMGSPADEDGRRTNEGPQHQVWVPPFFMGKYPVTQAQWRAVAVMENLKVAVDLWVAPARFPGDELPVERVSWLEAQEFCQRVTKLAQRRVNGVEWACQLPAEAQWEYACRAGSVEPFHFGPTISPELANYDGNYQYGKGPKGEYRKKTTPIGSFGVANAFGLYDMHGNVWEWCADSWHKDYENAPIDGSAWGDGKDSTKVLRGGSWLRNPNICRSAYRDWNYTDDLNGYCGFRVMYAPARTS